MLSGQDPVPREPVPLDDIVVRVVRTPFGVLELPFALSVSGDSLSTRGQVRLGTSEVLMNVPGVDVQDRYNYALGDRISVRGFGARTQFGIRSVRVFVDGIPATMADGQTTLDHLDLATVTRSEVIRGPSSALYGNASGGVIRFQTGRPPPAPFQQVFDIEGGSHGLARLTSSTSGRTGALTLGLDLTRFSYDGFRTYSAADKGYATGRAQYRLGADEFQLTGSYVDLAAQNPGSVTESVARADPTAANPFNVVQQTGKDANQGQLGLAWTRTSASATVQVAAFGLSRRVHNPIPVSVIDLDRLAGGIRAQVDGRATVSGRAAPWTVGAEALFQRDDRTNRDNDRGSAGALLLDQREQVVNVGLFGQMRVPLAARWSAFGGLRYDAFRFEVEDRFTQAGDPDDSGRRDMDALSPTVGIAFAVTRAMTWYANVTTAFETPTTSELANQPTGAGGFNATLEPQQAVSIEVGLKGGDPMGFRYDVALYRADVSDALIPFQVPGQPGRDFFRNAGSTRHQGVEAGAGWTGGGWTLRAAYRFTDATFVDYQTGTARYDGNRVPGVAPHAADVLATYSAPRGWYATSDVRASSAVPTNDANSAEAPAYAVVNVRVGWSDIGLGGLEVSPYGGVTNVFDAWYITAVTVNAFGQRYFEPGPARTWYLGTRVGFLVGR
jgi:iron complex outermembrane receptor protein